MNEDVRTQLKEARGLLFDLMLKLHQIERDTCEHQTIEVDREPDEDGNVEELSFCADCYKSMSHEVPAGL